MPQLQAYACVHAASLSAANEVLLDFAASYAHIVSDYQPDVTMHVLRPVLQ